MSGFAEYFKTLDIQTRATQDIEKTLLKNKFTLADLPTLLSPEASAFIEPIAQRSYTLTRQRFGNTMQIFVPMYLSNECYNNCTYCGFSIDFKYPRKILTEAEIVTEFELLNNKGFRHILLLTGEAPGKVGLDYISKAVAIAKRYFDSIGIEVQPFKQAEYELLINSGADSLTLYQETYHHDSYLKFHKSGKKRNYDVRLNAPDEGGKAKFYRMNIGALLGLYDWRYEAVSLAHHIDYLQKNYWQTKLGVSFPRIQDMFGDFTPADSISDLEFTQLICAFRLIFPDLSITLSTREKASLRDNLFKLGITAMSAESKTNPGGYAGSDSEGQFETSDHRSLEDIQQLLKDAKFDVVMKDWE